MKNTVIKGQRKSIFKIILDRREVTLVVFIAILIAVIRLRSPYFFNLNNFRDILLDTSILIIVAIGQMMVIITRGVDLSVASTLAFSGMAVALIVSHNWGIHPILAILMGMCIGLVLGSFTGFLVSKAKIPPIIATLATMIIFRGFVFLINDGAWVNASDMPDSFKHISRGTILGVPNLIIIVIVVSLIFYYFLGHTRTGRQIYAFGSNPDAARFVGIGVEKINFIVYMLSGILCGLAGVLWVSRYASAQPNSASGFELLTVAACVIGGVFIFGGSGSIPGVLLGSLLLGIVTNAVNLIRVSPFWKLAIQGLIILIAVITDTIIYRRVVRALHKGGS
ncbi:MAG: ABC transporter permease [Candidatus Humimicrobiaceae bacterium]